MTIGYTPKYHLTLFQQFMSSNKLVQTSSNNILLCLLVWNNTSLSSLTICVGAKENSGPIHVTMLQVLYLKGRNIATKLLNVMEDERM